MTRTASAATSYTLTQEDGVQPNTEFNLKVAAVTNIGSGPTSSSYFYVTVPEAPNVTAVNDENNPATSIYIRWTSQTHDNATLTRNRVEAALDSSPIPFAFLASASALEYQIVNLQPGTKYTLRVLVQNLDKDGRPQSSLYSEPIISYTNRWPQWTAGTVSEGGVGVYENETHIEAYMGVPLHLLFEVTDEDDKNVLDVTYIESAGSIPNGASLYDCNETCK
uniref:Fibronectin type-III domain-containing protein n=1 Tax=Palpitomonas bilix TaxID=652834 RepID=A0A7S3DC03_9EUKA|mmetsp:Transcript_30446/g.78855  ORF Transcript_30446/g.78855 Transcript_30446/m.78855 type:complete len:222 (+) Transcript_30446:77-742(+)